MDVNDLIFMPLSIIAFLIIIIITVILFIRMRQKKISNLKWLALYFLCQFFIGFVWLGKELAILEIAYYIIRLFSLVSLIVFTKETFYKDKKTIFIIVILLVVSLMVGSIIFVLVRSVQSNDMLYLLDLYFMGNATIITATWYAIASFSSFYIIKEKNIDKWIKLRYQILGIAAVIYIIQGFLITFNGIIEILSPVSYTLEFYTNINIILFLLFSIGNFYGWIILGRKKDNSKSELSKEDEISEEELTKMLKEEM